MTTATAPDFGPFKATFHVHGFGTWTLPLLHEIPDAVDYLREGRAADILMLDEVPSELLDAMKGRLPEDVARFFVMWIRASFDFEAGAWCQVLELHRTLFVGEDEEPEPSEGMQLANEMDDEAHDIAGLVFDSWKVLH